MAIIVQHKENRKKYILLGTGFGAFKSTRPSYFGGSLFPKNEEGSFKIVAICDKNNEILWCESKYLEVISIDGKTPADLIE